MVRHFIFGACFALSLFGTAQACGFHNYAPRPSMVEQLLSSDHILLARQSETNPFRYTPIKALKGPIDGVELPQLVDSVTRRKLAVSESDSVLFFLDPETGNWKRLAYVDSAMHPIVDEIMQNHSSWRLGGDFERFQLFADMIDHPNRQVRNLALRELDQADYSVLRELSFSLNVKGITSDIGPVQERELEPIRVLLLGLSTQETAQSFVKQGLNQNRRATGPVFGAYATAFVEAGKKDAVTNLVETYLDDPSLSMTNRELLIEALALHRLSGDLSLGMEILSALEHALAQNPELAPAAARQFGARHDWALRHVLSGALHSGVQLSEADVRDVTDYLAIAGQSIDPLQ
ncbi:hypothetical protein Q4525_03060 [Shimia thalassica]|uniref:hypothetical protein n=1 Tax=Shimia thalassica TaxID=1715693 RepID=UPI000C0763C1|nr:hypothetical protein [Shimia thalassica]MBU2943815.1 hypothetical protein [Shimia thalassica]MDO6501886.1 hypothetical protein [Shimia thalassica]PHO04244.1 hypothetical protein CSC82_06135 [Rhodobacteraceae bacterium 4F10]